MKNPEQQEVKNQSFKESLSTILFTLKEVSDDWTTGVMVTVRLLGSLSLLLALCGSIVVGTEWFIDTFGAGTFVFTMIISSFVFAFLTKLDKKG
jgi:hypothetical protein